MRNAGTLTIGDRFRGERNAGSVIARRLLCSDLRGTHRSQPLRRAKAFEPIAGRDQARGVVAIDPCAFALPVRTKWPADVGPLVPVEAEPVQRIQDGVLGRRRAARAICVLDAQDERAAGFARETIVDERHVRGPDVRISGR